MAVSGSYKKRKLASAPPAPPPPQAIPEPNPEPVPRVPIPQEPAPSKQLYRCSICGAVFNSEAALQEHLSANHQAKAPKRTKK